MGLVLKTAATDTAISIAEAKTWLRLDTDVDDDIVAGLIRAATEELRRKKQIVAMAEVWTLYLDYFCSRSIELELRPVSAVASIKYYDAAGALQTLDAANYQVDVKNFMASVSPTPDGSWPSTDGSKRNAVEIEFTVGYGATTAGVPATVKHALKCKVSALYYGDEGMEKAYEALAANEAVVHV